MRKLVKKENGQAMVEFALVLPFLILILCGILDFGWLFFNQLSVQNACREGARVACVKSSDPDVDTLVADKVGACLTPGLQDDLKVKVKFTNSSAPTEGDVEVTVEAKVRLLTPLMGTFFHNMEKELSDSVTMKVES